MGVVRTTSGTFVVPAGITEIVVECWGAGGTGGANGVYGGGGGGGGAYARSVLTVTPGTSYAVTVPQGSTTASANGGDAIFGSNLVVAKGGTGGATGGSLGGGAGGAGGSATNSVGQVKFAGGAGDAGFGTLNGGGGGGGAGSTGAGSNSTPNTSVGGAGGPGNADGLGAGGRGGDHLQVGTAPGGGGGGQVSLNPVGAGARGEVRIGYRYARSNTSALTLAGSVRRNVAKARSAPAALVGSVARQTNRNRAFATTFGGQSTPSQRTEILADSPFLYWRFEDLDSAATVADESGNNRVGVRQAVTKLREPGKHNFGIRNSDDAQSNYGYVQGSAADNSAHWNWGLNQPITMVGWFKLSPVLTDAAQPWIWSYQGGLGTTRAYLYRTSETSANGSQIMFIPDAAIAFAWGGTGQGGTLMPRGEWVHLALTYDAQAAPNGTAELFINGVSQGTRTGGGGWGDANSYWMLGGSPGNLSGYFNGWIDEFAIFFGVKSADRIARYANAPTTAEATTGIRGSYAKQFVPGPRIAALSLSTTMRRGVAVLRSVPLTLTGSKVLRVATQPKTAVLSLLGAASRRANAFRSFTTGLTLGTARARAITYARAFTSPLTLAATHTRRLLIVRMFTAALTLTATRGARIVTRSRSAALSLGSAVAKAANANRQFSAPLTLGTVFGRSVNTARRFTASLPLSTRGRVDMPMTVLNRMAGGAVSIVKKLLVIFDD